MSSSERQEWGRLRVRLVKSLVIKSLGQGVDTNELE